jgi:hypothetical protein
LRDLGSSRRAARQPRACLRTRLSRPRLTHRIHSRAVPPFMVVKVESAAQTDAQLIAEGEGRFTELYRRHAPAVYAWFRARLAWGGGGPDGRDVRTGLDLPAALPGRPRRVGAALAARHRPERPQGVGPAGPRRDACVRLGLPLDLAQNQGGAPETLRFETWQEMSARSPYGRSVRSTAVLGSRPRRSVERRRSTTRPRTRSTQTPPARSSPVPRGAGWASRVRPRLDRLRREAGEAGARSRVR